MENINMPTQEKVRTGPKSKKPEDIHKAVAFYAPQKDIDTFGGIEFARKFCAAAFAEHLEHIKTSRAKRGKK